MAPKRWPRLDDLTPQIGERGLPGPEQYPMKFPGAWPVTPIQDPLKNALWPSIDVPPPGAPRPQRHPIGPWKEDQSPSWPGNYPTPKDQVPFDGGAHLPKHERYKNVDSVIDGVPYNHDPQQSMEEQHQELQPYNFPVAPMRPPRNQG